MIQYLDEKFDEKIKELNELLPKLKVSANCAELTLISFLDILGIDNHFFHNTAIPLTGGFGGYKSKTEWQGACSAVCGDYSAIGVILGGDERMDNEIMLKAYLKVAKFASEFEKEWNMGKKLLLVCSMGRR
ncbi:MAG: C_GCAxxG_C_C family protein [Candidatus Lokiarchaeota archaeon]|nr:C_GCAxxG_C_C family protein [Candidatus Lokiarchaeota archaeon]